MNPIIYLVEASGGHWDDAWSYIETAFFDKEKAEAFVKAAVAGQSADDRTYYDIIELEVQ